jgi:hypothetical protein
MTRRRRALQGRTWRVTWTTALMPSRPAERYDFFLSRRGSVAAVAREVTEVLTEKGYRVLTQDYDIPLGASFIEKMHEASNSRDLIILFTRDYLQSPYTRKEFTSFEAERAQSQEERHIIILRCEDVPLRGLLADNVYQDLVGVKDPEERRRRIIAAGAPVTGSATAASTVHRGATAHRELHGPLRRTRPARCDPDAR